MNAPANLNTPQFRGKILLAVISYRYELDFRVRDSIEAACFGLAARNWLPVPTTKKANADLEHGRNTLAAEFAMSKEKFDKAVFVDGDVSCDPGTIERLVEHPPGPGRRRPGRERVGEAVLADVEPDVLGLAAR